MKAINGIGVAVCLLVAGSAAGQAAGDTSTERWSIGGVRVSGVLDGYYSLNLNHPSSGRNQLRNFDVDAGQFSLNLVKVTLERPAEPLGFRLDLGAGGAYDLIHAAGNSPGGLRYFEQAFVAFKPPGARGLQVDFGKFVTSAGAEVIETQSNWNYSRSLLFAWAIPYYHFGVRALMPLGKGFSAGAQLVNGWNNIRDNNGGKTVGFTGAWSNSRITWSHTYYRGNESERPSSGRRRLYDTTFLLTPSSRLAMYANFDYGADREKGAGTRRWSGIAGAARFAVSRSFAVAPRLEWFNDAGGFATGTAQKIKEVSVTGEYKFVDGLVSRLEYRRDWSDHPFFDRGATPAAYRHQDTFLAGVIASFGAKK